MMTLVSCLPPTDDEKTPLAYAEWAGFSSVKALAEAWVERDKMLKEMVDALDQVKEVRG